MVTPSLKGKIEKIKIKIKFMSINANEIRVGNYLWDDTAKKYYQVDASDIVLISRIPLLGTEEKTKKKLLESVSQPIPLTAEILLKCGFKDTGTRIVGSDEPINWRNENALIEKKYGAFVYVLYSDEWGSSLESIEIKSVHQLQNLHFAITVKELNIEL